MKIVLIIIIFISFKSFSLEYGSETGLKIPRYVSIKSNDANVRIGPSINYPIVIKYVVENYPIIIDDEYDDWRKIKDSQGNTGWIHKSLIKGERNGIIINHDEKNPVKIYNSADGKIIGEIYTDIIVKLEKCKISWCLISFKKNKGWVQKNYLWGVDLNEEFNLNLFQKFTDLYWLSLNNLDNIFNKLK